MPSRLFYSSGWMASYCKLCLKIHRIPILIYTHVIRMACIWGAAPILDRCRKSANGDMCQLESRMSIHGHRLHQLPLLMLCHSTYSPNLSTFHPVRLPSGHERGHRRVSPVQSTAQRAQFRSHSKRDCIRAVVILLQFSYTFCLCPPETKNHFLAIATLYRVHLAFIPYQVTRTTTKCFS